MPATTNPTPAEISRLERDIAEGVMGWRLMNGYFYSHPQWRKPDGTQVPVHIDGYRPGWSPWRNIADAWTVLERLESLTGRWATIEHVKDLWLVGLGDWEDYVTDAIGPHFGPAVCRLAENILDRK